MRIETGLEHFRDILVHLMVPLSHSGRRVAQRDVVHRASGATHPNGLGAPPKAAHQGPVAALRFLDDAPHRPANRAYPRGLGERSNGSEYPGNALGQGHPGHPEVTVLVNDVGLAQAVGFVQGAGQNLKAQLPGPCLRHVGIAAIQAQFRPDAPRQIAA